MSYATYPEPGYNCTKWTTDAEMKESLAKLNTSSGGLVAASVIYIVIGFGIWMSPNGRESLKFALPMLISGAIGLGTSIPLLRLKDATKVDEPQIVNLYNISAATLAAPVATFFVYMLGHFMTKGLRGRVMFPRYAYSARGDQGLF